MSDAPQDRCALAHAAFTPLVGEIRGIHDALIGLQSDVAHMRPQLDSLDKAIRGNGTPGLTATQAVHAQRLDDLAEKMSAHEKEDVVSHAAEMGRRWALFTAIVACVLSALLSLAMASAHRAPAAVPFVAASATPSPAPVTSGAPRHH